MAALALELENIRPAISIWQAYDSTLKADLFSTALITKAGLLLVDPIELAAEPAQLLFRQAPLAGVVITNGNHLRAAPAYVERFSIPFFAHRASRKNGSLTGFFTEVNDGATIFGEINVITIEGAGPGEIALYHATDGGTLIVGDALINFEPHGFAFLPAKYCEDAKQMRKSLPKLLQYNAQRMLFAHGIPILSGAGSRLRQLLDID
jgi:glyoxylase-like metal-dependent hydrolase (beta-lactamase superfamily II)